MQTLDLDGRRTWSASRSTSPPRGARTRSPTATGPAARTWCWAACTSRRCPRRRSRTPTRSSSARPRRRGRGSSRTRARAARPSASTGPLSRTLAGVPRVRRDLIRRELYLVPNSLVVSRGLSALVRRSATRTASSRAAASFYAQQRGRGPGRDRPPAGPPPVLPRRPPVRPRRLRLRSLRRDAAAWNGSGRPRARSTPCCGRGSSRGPSRAACAASSSGSRRSTPRACGPTASARTSGATTAPRSAGSTTSA